MDALAADVDPDKRVAPFVVDCALADDVRGVEDQFWSHPLRSRNGPPPSGGLSLTLNLSYETKRLTTASATGCIQNNQSCHTSWAGMDLSLVQSRPEAEGGLVEGAMRAIN